MKKKILIIFIGVCLGLICIGSCADKFDIQNNSPSENGTIIYEETLWVNTTSKEATENTTKEETKAPKTEKATKKKQEVKTTAEITTEKKVKKTTEKSDTGSNQQTYILNTNTGKFHFPYCSSVKDMKDTNKKEFHGTREEVINQGYKPCGNCKP